MAEEHKKEEHKEPAKTGEKPDGGKKGGWIEQHKVIAYGAAVVILVVLFIFLRKGSSSSSSQGQDTAAGTSQLDPATGYPAGSAADIAALNGGSGVSASTPSGGGSTTTTNNYYSGTGSTSTGTGGTATGGVTPLPAGYTIGSNGLINSGRVDESYTQRSNGQTLKQVAKNLGISVSSLIGSNASGKKAASNPNAKVAEGAKFTYIRTIS